MLVKFRKHLRGAAEAAAKRKGALASLQQDVLKRQQDVREADCDTANLASDAPAGEPQDHDLTGTAAIIANLDSSLEVFSFILESHLFYDVFARGRWHHRHLSLTLACFLRRRWQKLLPKPPQLTAPAGPSLAAQTKELRSKISHLER